MRKLVFAAAAAAMLTGCATVQGSIASAGKVMCDRREDVRTSLLVTIQNAVFIDDPVVRAATIGSAQAGLDALAACPPRP